MVDLRVKQYSGFVHPFLSIFVPFVFFSVVVVLMIGGGLIVRGVRLFPPFFPLILLVAGAAETITGNLLQKERISGMLPRLRELILVLIVSFGLILLFFGDLTTGDINLARANIWLSLIVVALQWIISFRIHTRLRDRELFLGFFEGREPRTFPEVYSTHNHEGGNAFNGLRSIRKLMLTLITIGFLVLVIMAWGVGLELSPGGRLLVYFFFVSFFLVLSVLGRYMEMLRTLADGHVPSRRQTGQKNATMVLVLIAATLLALPLAGADAWLPVRHLTGFWDWLVELLTLDRVAEAVRAPEIEETITEAPLPEMTPLQGVVGTRDESVIADIARYLLYAAIGLLGVGFLVFLIMPVLRLRDSQTNLFQAAGQAVRNALGSIVRGWRAFVAALRSGLKHGRRVGATLKRVREQAKAAALARDAAAARRPKISKEERKLHNQVLKSFMRFVRWAGRHDVAFSTSIGPREFAGMVAARVPEHAADCMEVGELFEEIVFSRHETGSELQARYHDKVTAVVKSRS